MSGAVSTIVVFVLGLTAAVANAQPDRPLPLDPLTPGELARADSVVRSDVRVREFLAGGRSRLIGIEFIAVKLPRDPATPDGVQQRRTADALLYRYDTNQGMRALVDIGRGAVLDIASVPGESVPINRDEVAEAARIALADRRVTRLFGDRMPAFRVATGPPTREDADKPIIEGLRTVGATRKDPCYRRRCVVLFFHVNNNYVQMNRVFVDLIGERVFVDGAGR
jgi:Cu2+-containing amine oxidase